MKTSIVNTEDVGVGLKKRAWLFVGITDPLNHATL